ncbi:MAG: ferric reductase-like transmembrane domain-containing protein [Ilumatobacteraceae bacterium]
MIAATQWTWFLTRATGSVALLLLSLSAVLGMIVTIGWSSRQLSMLVVNGLHRNVSLIAVAFIVGHVATTVLDAYVDIGWTSAVVPFAAEYRRFWLGLGAVAFDLVLALVVTSLLRLRIPHRAWRSIHLGAYGCLPIAVVHALGTGSDVRSHLIVWLVGVCGAGLAGTLAWRLSARRVRDPRVATAVIAAAVAVPIVIALWTIAGPLQPGWGTS